MMIFIAVAVSGITLPGCHKSVSPESDNSSGLSDIYAIETEPSLSPARDYVYYISRDTIIESFSGIYRAKSKNPIRERILLGGGFHSPTMAFDRNTVAYLKNYHINYFRISDSSHLQSAISQNFESIVYVNDTLLLGCSQGSIYTIDEDAQEVKYLVPGRDPTLYKKDTFVYIGEIESIGLTEYEILRSSIDGEIIEKIFEIGSFSLSYFPRWPSVEPQKDRIAYVISGPDGFIVYASESKANTARVIDTSMSDKPYIIDYNRIIFTGEDGRFYQSNFSGTTIFPYWGQIEEM